MKPVFPYLRRDDGVLRTLGLPAGTYTIHFTEPFPSLWRSPLRWLFAIPRLLECLGIKATGTIVCQLETKETAVARGWSQDSGMTQ